MKQVGNYKCKTIEMKKLPKKLKNGYYKFTCSSKAKFTSALGYVNRIVLYNEVLTSRINSYQITSLDAFYKEYDVIEVEFKKDL